MHGAFIVLTDGSNAHFIAGGHKINANDVSEPEFSTGENAWLPFDDANLPQWLWLFQQTISNGTSPTSDEKIFTIPALQYTNETARLSTVAGAPHLSFYAGVPLISKGGQPVGVLFVVNTVERTLLSIPEANFLIRIGDKCVDILDRAREHSFHSKWTILQQQLDIFAQSHVLRSRILKENRTYEGRTSSTTTTNDNGPGVMRLNKISYGTLERSEFLETEENVSAIPARSEVHLEKIDTQSDHTHNVTSKTKLEEDDERSERNEGIRETVYRKVFRKAAQCLQHALDADGVMFADGLVGLHGEIQPTAESELELVREFAQPPRRPSDGCEDSFQSNSRTFTSAEYRKGVYTDNPAEIFGMSGSSDQLNLSPISNSSPGLSGVDDGFLERLMDRHPTGAIWYFTETCILQAKDGTLFKGDFQEEMSRLRSTFPSIKQLMYVPLNDPTSSKRLCACFAWRNEASPVFTSAVDLGSVKVFSRVVESEIGRYDTAAVAKQKETFVSSVSHELSKTHHPF